VADPPKFDVVIDHHPLREACEASYVDIRPEYGSTSTIVTEYLTDAGLSIPRKIATSLLYGLITDTGDLSRNTGRADIEAYQDVHARADHHFISRLQKSVIPRPILDGLAWGIQHRVVIGEAIVVHYGSIDMPDLLVQTADFLLLTLGIWWVAIAGIHEGKLIVVFRGDGHRQDVGTRARLAFARKGSAGGHRTMGRAEIALTDESTDDTIAILVEGLFRRFKPKRRQALIRQFREHLKTPFHSTARGISSSESKHA
jgi:nanoRNase/pAp phosphatase (c-di-AMP/oligoRNAs hydrolase)